MSDSECTPARPIPRLSRASKFRLNLNDLEKARAIRSRAERASLRQERNLDEFVANIELQIQRSLDQLLELVLSGKRTHHLCYIRCSGAPASYTSWDQRAVAEYLDEWNANMPVGSNVCVELGPAYNLRRHHRVRSLLLRF